MSATLSQTGTWTTIAIDTTSAATTGPNVPVLKGQQLYAFANADWPELRDFVQMVATAYGINFQGALVLVNHGLRALLNRSDLPSSDTYIQ